MANVSIAPVTLAGHLLTEAGSAIVRALDLLEPAIVDEQLGPMSRALTEAIARVNAVRQVVDGVCELERAERLGRAADPQGVALLELGREQLAELAGGRS